MTHWWHSSVVYSIFVPTFADSNGDGIGDLAGIRSRLGYLKWLGVDCIWLGPVYRSPMLDAGYDIADFCAVDPLFGGEAEFDALLADVHRMGMKLVMDFVPNHTSDQHPWFLEARSSRQNPKRDWYIWADPRPGGSPPTNWVDNVEQPAWTWDEKTGQYYYRIFLPGQPDLNLRNPEVVAAIEDVMRYWMKRGVDGLRLDTAMNLFEDEHLRDEPKKPGVDSGPPGWMDHLFTSDRPEGRDLIRRFRGVLDEFDERLFIGEVIAPVTRMMAYYGDQSGPGMHLPFNNQLMKTEPWDARMMDAAIDQYLNVLPEGAYPNWVIGSHDVPRIASRVGQGQARVAAMLLLTLPGTIFLYYGDELGLENIFVRKDQVRDPYDTFGDGRDPYRSPMPWDGSDKADFTTGEPYLPIHAEVRDRNVEAQQADSGSILNLYRSLVALRREQPALRETVFQPVRAEGELLSFLRPHLNGTLQVVLNFGKEPQEFQLRAAGELLLSTHLDRSGRCGPSLSLRPVEGVIVRLEPEPAPGVRSS